MTFNLFQNLHYYKNKSTFKIIIKKRETEMPIIKKL